MVVLTLPHTRPDVSRLLGIGSSTAWVYLPHCWASNGWAFNWWWDFSNDKAQIETHTFPAVHFLTWLRIDCSPISSYVNTWVAPSSVRCCFRASISFLPPLDDNAVHTKDRLTYLFLTKLSVFHPFRAAICITACPTWVFNIPSGWRAL